MSEEKGGPEPAPVPVPGAKAKIGFEMRRIEVALEAILPVRKIKDPHKLARYQAIVSSIPEVDSIGMSVCDGERAGDEPVSIANLFGDDFTPPSAWHSARANVVHRGHDVCF